VRSLPPGNPRRWLLAVLAGGLGFRLLLAYVLLPTSGYWSDLTLFSSWAHSLAYAGPARFYATAGFADYPPGFLVVLWLVALLSNALNPDDVFLTRELIKLPSMLADVAIALAVYLAIRRLASERAAIVAAAVCLLHPITWLDSALWGQNDAVGALLLVLAVLALARRQPELACLAAATALLVKPQFAILAPLVAVVLLYRYVVPLVRRRQAGDEPNAWAGAGDPRRLLTCVAAAALPLFLVPALFGQSPLDLFLHMSQQANLYPWASMSAFNPWAVFSLVYGDEPPRYTQLLARIDDRQPVFLFLTPYAVGLTLFVLAAAVALWRLWRALGTEHEELELWVCSSTLVFAFFVLATRMHERYAFPFFALALPVAVLSARWRGPYALATAVCFANIYESYALSTADTKGFTPDTLTAALATPLAMGTVGVLSGIALIWLLAARAVPGVARRPASEVQPLQDLAVARREPRGALQERNRGRVVARPES
jgi:4-amino-4-deoxy-L-arabinose transferase-like glycosyltransferase